MLNGRLTVTDEKNIEIKAKIILKKMPKAEYEAIMIPYKKLMLQFERTLRQLADNGTISFSIVDKFTKEFNFAELQRLHFDSPEEQESFLQARTQQPVSQFASQPQQQSTFGSSQPQPATARPFGMSQAQPQYQATGSGFSQTQTPQNPTAQRPSGFTFGQAQHPAPTPSSNYGFGKSESPAFGTPSSSPRPGTAPPQSSFARQESQQNVFGSTGTGLSSFSDLSKDANPPTPAFSPRSPPPAQPSFMPSSSDFNSQSKPQDSKVSVGIDEEDRATGIAILRKKMLMELRKIRNVVEQEDDSTF